jgi:hypothetical protein
MSLRRIASMMGIGLGTVTRTVNEHRPMLATGYELTDASDAAEGLGTGF